MSLLELFVDVDDFCQIFLPVWERALLGDGARKRLRKGQLTVSEIMTITIHFYQSDYRDFKTYYIEHVCKQLRSESPTCKMIHTRFQFLDEVRHGAVKSSLDD